MSATAPAEREPTRSGPPVQLILFAVVGVAAVAAVAARLLDAPPPAVFAVAGLAMMGLAWIVGVATEELAATTGPKIGALLNAGFGNVAELALVFLLLADNQPDVVKASLAGSILGNALLVLGLAFFVGGVRHGVQTFDRRAAAGDATLLIIAVVALFLPAGIAGDLTEGVAGTEERQLALVLGAILLTLYVISVFKLLREPAHVEEGEHASQGWSRPRSLITLFVAAVSVAIVAEILVGAIEPTAEDVGLPTTFIGLILVPIVGNLAEHLVAVQLAAKNRAAFAVGVVMNSTLQIALLVIPIAIFASVLIGSQQLTMVFTPLELIGLGGGVIVLYACAQDGESNWFEGVMLMGVYAIVAGCTLVLE